MASESRDADVKVHPTSNDPTATPRFPVLLIIDDMRNHLQLKRKPNSSQAN